MHAGVDLTPRQPAHAGLVDRAVAREWRDESGSATCPQSAHVLLRVASGFSGVTPPRLLRSLKLEPEPREPANHEP